MNMTILFIKLKAMGWWETAIGSAGAVLNRYLAVSVSGLGAWAASCSDLRQHHNIAETPLKAFTPHIQKDISIKACEMLS